MLDKREAVVVARPRRSCPYARSTNGSKHSRIIGPMQQRLSLPAPTVQIAAPAVFPHLRHMPLNAAPAANLTFVVGTASAKKIAAVPLEPASRIFVVDPPIRTPDR